MDISTINPATTGKIEQKTGINEQQTGHGFKETVNNFINDVNDLQLKAGESIENFASGDVENVHEVMIAMSKAEVSFKFMMETRNKLVDAYKEIMKMPI
jgi:flagellar hook-basal body complex protein FliE